MSWNKKWYNRWNKRVLAGTMAVMMVGSTVLAGNVTAGTANAAETPSQKEEVVYCILDSEGKVNGVYVVNSFAGGEVVDYGTYTKVKNLTTTDEITTSGDRITLHTDADKVFYQGDLETKEIPWDIKVTYKMDGKEYSAKEIAGMTGKAEVHISIKENKSCPDTFWNGYALQATITLDGDKCKNIKADGATIANVGSNKQLSYIVLPGKGAELTIKTDATEFEMSEIAINGVKLNLDFDTSEFNLGEDVEKLVDAIEKLDDGSRELSDGAKELNEGIKTMQAGLNELNKQSGTLTEGSGEVLVALRTIQDSLNQVAVTSQDLSELSNASTQIKNGIDALTGGLQQMDGSIDTYYASLAQVGMTDMNSYLANHDAMIANLTKAMEMVPVEQKAMYQQMITLISADKAYIEGSSQLIGGIDASLDSQNGQLMVGAMTLQKSYAEFDKNIQMMVGGMATMAENMTALKNGINTLATNYEALDSGINEYTKAVVTMAKGYKQIVNGSKELADGTKELYDGTTELREETAGMNTEIEDTVNDTMDELIGKDIGTVSFVSNKNINVESVLFVMKVPAVEIPEVEEVDEVEEELTLWEKFMAIFK